MQRLEGHRELSDVLFRYPLQNRSAEDRQAIFVALFAVINKGINDKRTDVNQEAAKVFTEMVEKHYNRFDHLVDDDNQAQFVSHSKQIVDNLIWKCEAGTLKLS